MIQVFNLDLAKAAKDAKPLVALGGDAGVGSSDAASVAKKALLLKTSINGIFRDRPASAGFGASDRFAMSTAIGRGVVLLDSGFGWRL